jgi:hypothetical protein
VTAATISDFEALWRVELPTTPRRGIAVDSERVYLAAG